MEYLVLGILVRVTLQLDPGDSQNSIYDSKYIKGVGRAATHLDTREQLVRYPQDI